jgi:hypothetical protein
VQYHGIANSLLSMPLQGEYEPNLLDFVREQVDLYEL